MTPFEKVFKEVYGYHIVEEEPIVNEMIINEPEPVRVLDYSIMATMKEYHIIMKALRKSFMSVKEIHQLYYNSESGTYDRGLKTIYRYIEKLMDEGLVIEVGQRMTQGSRAVETLYGPVAKVFFYEGPQVMEQYRSEEYRKQIKIMGKLVEAIIDEPIDTKEFEEFTLEYLESQDRISSDLLKKIKENDELVELIKTVPPDHLGKLIFTSSDLVHLWIKTHK